MARIYLSPPDVGQLERELLLDAFDSNWIAPLGPHVDAFEREFAVAVGVPYAVALSSGTGALHLGLAALGVGPGDHVLTSTLTFAATANAITYVGATPVFIDASRDTWTMDPDLLEEELAAQSRSGRLPAAVLAVDLYGQCCDYERLAAVCERYGVPLVEDAAEALGAVMRRLAGPVRSVRARLFRSTATRSSPPAVAACWSRTAGRWSIRPGTSRRRPVTPRHIMSIRKSGSTIG